MNQLKESHQQHTEEHQQQKQEGEGQDEQQHNQQQSSIIVTQQQNGGLKSGKILPTITTHIVYANAADALADERLSQLSTALAAGAIDSAHDVNEQNGTNSSLKVIADDSTPSSDVAQSSSQHINQSDAEVPQQRNVIAKSDATNEKKTEADSEEEKRSKNEEKGLTSSDVISTPRNSLADTPEGHARAEVIDDELLMRKLSAHTNANRQNSSADESGVDTPKGSNNAIISSHKNITDEEESREPTPKTSVADANKKTLEADEKNAKDNADSEDDKSRDVESGDVDVEEKRLNDDFNAKHEVGDDAAAKVDNDGKERKKFEFIKVESIDESANDDAEIILQQQQLEQRRLSAAKNAQDQLRANNDDVPHSTIFAHNGEGENNLAPPSKNDEKEEEVFEKANPNESDSVVEVGDATANAQKSSAVNDAQQRDVASAHTISTSGYDNAPTPRDTVADEILVILNDKNQPIPRDEIESIGETSTESIKKETPGNDAPAVYENVDDIPDEALNLHLATNSDVVGDVIEEEEEEQLNAEKESTSRKLSDSRDKMTPHDDDKAAPSIHNTEKVANDEKEAARQSSDRLEYNEDVASPYRDELRRDDKNEAEEQLKNSEKHIQKPEINIEAPPEDVETSAIGAPKKVSLSHSEEVENIPQKVEYEIQQNEEKEKQQKWQQQHNEDDGGGEAQRTKREEKVEERDKDAEKIIERRHVEAQHNEIQQTPKEAQAAQHESGAFSGTNNKERVESDSEIHIQPSPVSNAFKNTDTKADENGEKQRAQNDEQQKAKKHENETSAPHGQFIDKDAAEEQNAVEQRNKAGEEVVPAVVAIAELAASVAREPPQPDFAKTSAANSTEERTQMLSQQTPTEAECLEMEKQTLEARRSDAQPHEDTAQQADVEAASKEPKRQPEAEPELMPNIEHKLNVAINSAAGVESISQIIGVHQKGEERTAGTNNSETNSAANEKLASQREADDKKSEKFTAKSELAPIVADQQAQVVEPTSAANEHSSSAAAAPSTTAHSQWQEIIEKKTTAANSTATNRPPGSHENAQPAASNKVQLAVSDAKDDDKLHASSDGGGAALRVGQKEHGAKTPTAADAQASEKKRTRKSRCAIL